VTQRRACAFFILGTCAPLVVAAPRHGRRGGWWLMAAIMDKLGEQLRAPAGKFILSLLGRFVLTRATRSRRLRSWGVSRGGHVSTSALRIGGVAGVIGTSGEALSKNVANGGKTVGGLMSRVMVNMRQVGQVGGLIGDVTR
jgi:hypothetical protein